MSVELERMATAIVDAAFHLHAELGPGMVELVYEVLLMDELRRRGYDVERQKRVSFEYAGRIFRSGFRVDLVVNGQIVIEVKSAQRLTPANTKQLLTYLKLMHLPLGFVINFGGYSFKDNIRRVANDLIA